MFYIKYATPVIRKMVKISKKGTCLHNTIRTYLNVDLHIYRKKTVQTQ